MQWQCLKVGEGRLEKSQSVESSFRWHTVIQGTPRSLQTESEVPDDLFTRVSLKLLTDDGYMTGSAEKIMEAFAYLEVKNFVETFTHHWSPKLVRACWSSEGYGRRRQVGERTRQVRILRVDDDADEWLPPIYESLSSRNGLSLETTIPVNSLSFTDPQCAQFLTWRTADQICRPQRDDCARNSGALTESHGDSWSKRWDTTRVRETWQLSCREQASLRVSRLTSMVTGLAMTLTGHQHLQGTWWLEVADCTFTAGRHNTIEWHALQKSCESSFPWSVAAQWLWRRKTLMQLRRRWKRCLQQRRLHFLRVWRKRWICEWRWRIRSLLVSYHNLSDSSGSDQLCRHFVRGVCMQFICCVFNVTLRWTWFSWPDPEWLFCCARSPGVFCLRCSQ